LVKNELKNGEQAISIFALLGFIFGLLSFLLVITTGFPFLMAAAAIVLSSIALHRFRTGKDEGRGKGFAIAGLIIGILSMLIFWAIVVVVILILSSVFYW
jgi:cobalamin synthase